MSFPCLSAAADADKGIPLSMGITGSMPGNDIGSSPIMTFALGNDRSMIAKLRQACLVGRQAKKGRFATKA